MAAVAELGVVRRKSKRTEENAACRGRRVYYSYRVSLENIKTEIASMPQDHQDQLAAYLVHLRHQRDPKIPAEIRNRIEDKDPANWLSLDDLKERWKD